MGCWFSLCMSRRCLGTPYLFVFFFFLLLLFFFLLFFLNVLIKHTPWALHSHTAKQQYRLVLDRFVFKLRQRSSVLYRKMKVTFHPLVLSNFKNNIQQKLTYNGWINPYTRLTYHVDVDIHSYTEKLNCRHSFNTWNTEIDNLCGENPAIIDDI